MSSRNFVSRPTCHNAFPPHEIELHADACAEEKYGSVDENQYNSLMASFVDSNQYEDENMFEAPSVIDLDDASKSLNDDAIIPQNHKEKIKEAITRINYLVPDTQNRYHIRRKTIFNDYVSTRERSKWMKPENKIKVTFVGESGIDVGGPKREFLTGKNYVELFSG